MNVDRLLKKLDAMPGTNVDLKDAIRRKLCAQRQLTLPYAKGSDTSKEAAESMQPHASQIRERVFEYVKNCGDWGATCDIAEQALGLSHQTCSARFNELRNAGRLIDSGKRRVTRSGRKAVVYTVAR